MMKSLRPWVLACLTAALASHAFAQEVNPVGVWSLRAMTFVNTDTGAVSEPWGKQPVGQLTYSANGRMIAVLTADPSTRKPVDPAASTAVEQRAALYVSSSAYSGTWSAAGSTFTHKVDVATNAAWVGTHQMRYVTLDKDTLTIDTQPIEGHDGKATYKIRLVWSRVP